MDQVSLLKLVVSIRAMQLYYHYCHNLTSGPTFGSDHAMFNDFYSELACQYDQVAEYTVATIGVAKFDTVKISKAISMRLDKLSVEAMSPDKMFKEGLKLEKSLQEDLEEVDEKGSLGMKNLIGELAQTSDVRTYKIQQRLD